MKLIDRLPGFCQPIGFTIDIDRMVDACEAFLTSIFLNDEARQARCTANGFATVNLTHMPHVTGDDRMFKYSGNKYALIENKIEEKDFTILVSELADTYIGQTIREIERRHFAVWKTQFVGRHQLIWVNPMSCYPIHRDKHTPHRYHIPIKTNPEAWWLFRDDDKDIKVMHMPADGRVWYLNPIQQEHTVANLGHTPRYHLLMTSAV